VTIVGAHLDSINLNSPSTGRAPGADDDGTGVVNLIEAFRALVAAGFRPSTPVEFHWYAAEEVGLLGSQAIATNYKNAGVAVKAFMQLDMSA
jgi:leucyl aminopeptidase